MLEVEHRTFTKDSFKSIINTQCTLSNFSCGFIKVPYTVKGNNFILVIIDAFSKFVITKAIKKKTACTEFTLKFGMCKHLSIISDNGLEFINRWSKTLYKLLGVKSIRTSLCISLQRTVSARDLIARSLVYCGNLYVITLKIGQRIYVMSPM